MAEGEKHGLLQVSASSRDLEDLEAIKSKGCLTGQRTTAIVALSLVLSVGLAIGIFMWDRSTIMLGSTSGPAGSPVAGIFYINVNASSPRGVTIERHLQEISYGVPYRRFQAVSPMDLPHIDTKQWSNGDVAERVRVRPTKERLGTIACYLSHVVLVNHLTQEEDAQDRPHLILEDDARLLDSWQEDIKQAMDAVPSDWDVLKVGWSFMTRPADRVNDQIFEARGPFYKNPNFFYLGSQGYLVRPRAIPAYMACLRGHIIDDIDKIQVESDCIKTYVAAKKAVTVHPFPSDRQETYR